jgi:hypothetical protein
MNDKERTDKLMEVHSGLIGDMSLEGVIPDQKIASVFFNVYHIMYSIDVTYEFST